MPTLVRILLLLLAPLAQAGEGPRLLHLPSKNDRKSPILRRASVAVYLHYLYVRGCSLHGSGKQKKRVGASPSFDVARGPERARRGEPVLGIGKAGARPGEKRPSWLDRKGRWLLPWRWWRVGVVLVDMALQPQKEMTGLAFNTNGLLRRLVPRPCSGSNSCSGSARRLSLVCGA